MTELLLGVLAGVGLVLVVVGVLMLFGAGWALIAAGSGFVVCGVAGLLTEVSDATN